MTPDEIAKSSAEAMWTQDNCSHMLGFHIEHVEAGAATLSMTIREDMVNGLKTCHGGIMFSLADSAFAFACNSYNQMAVAQQCSISFLQPVYAGDVLIATATERAVQGRTGIYDVTIKRADTVVAEFRGQSRTITGQHFAPVKTSPESSEPEPTNG